VSEIVTVGHVGIMPNERTLMLDMRVIFVDILPGKNAAVHEERKAPVCPPSARV